MVNDPAPLRLRQRGQAMSAGELRAAARRGPHDAVEVEGGQLRALLLVDPSGEVVAATPPFWRHWQRLPSIVSYVRGRGAAASMTHVHRPVWRLPVPAVTVLPPACPSPRRHQGGLRLRPSRPALPA